MRRTVGPGRMAAALVAALAAAFAAGAQARATLWVSPLVLEATAAACPARLGPVLVVNGADSPAAVEVDLAGLSHDLDGFPVFLTGAQERARASALVTPAWQQATLQPGEGRELWFDVKDCPAEGGYAAALVSTPVETGWLQVAVLLLLHGGAARPGEGMVLESLWAQQAAAGAPVELVARVRNVGQAAGTARVQAWVLGPGGEVQGRVWLGPGRLLPGGARLLRGLWEPPLLPPGRYAVQAWLEPAAGSSAPQVAAELEVVRPYELAMARGSVSLSLAGSPSGLPSVVASVHNQGSRPVRPRLEVTFARGEQVAASTRVSVEEVEPGAVAGVEVPWPAGLPPGEYRVAAVWLDGARPVAEGSLEVSFAGILARRGGEPPSP